MILMMDLHRPHNRDSPFSRTVCQLIALHRVHLFALHIAVSDF